MKRFLKHTTIFAILVLLTLLAGECLISSQPNPHKLKHHFMAELSSNVECVILGSSHTFYGIRPELLSQNAFNLANISQNFEYDNILLRKYADRCDKLKAIILPISYFSFFDKDFEHSDEDWRITSYKKYMDINLYPDYSKYNFEFSNLPIYSGKLKCALKGQMPIECDSLGFGLGYDISHRSHTWKEEVGTAIDRHTAPDMSMLEYNIKHLRLILDFCEKRAIKVILITTPTYHSYYNGLNSGQLNKMYEVTKMIADEYQLPYIDYLRDNRFTDDDFHDGDHLSTSGAAKFTQILNNDIREFIGNP